jgi:WD repeat-containing protein 22
MVAGYSYAFHSVQFNPVEPRLLIAANQKAGIGLWDIRQAFKTFLSSQND